MSIVSSWKPIIERLRIFCEGHALIPSDANGNKPFTHGQADIIDIQQQGVYPLMHVTPLNVVFDPRTKSNLYTIEVVFAGKPYTEDDKSEYVTEVLSDTAQLCHDLISTIHNSTYELFDRAVTLEGASTANIFIDEFSQVLSGHTMSLTLRVPNGHSFCDVPVDFNLNTGSGGSGSNFGANYLKSVAVAGQSTVVSTQPADTFTFVAGSGMTITTNALTKTITFSSSSGGSFVVGPPSAVNNRIAVFDGTTGSLIKDGGALIADLLTTAAAALAYQPLDSDLTAIAGLSPANDDFIQRKSGAWTNRTIVQVQADLDVLTATAAALTYLTQANAALTYLTQANAALTYLTQASAALTYLTQANAASTYLSIANADEVAQDAVGNMVDATLVYIDGTPVLKRAVIGGDIDIPDGSNTAAIGVNKVVNNMLAQVATSTIKGRATAGTGNVEDLTGTQVTALLDVFTPSAKGVVPVASTDNFKFLRADALWSNFFTIPTIQNENQVVPRFGSIIVSQFYEIASGFDLEIGEDAYFEIT